MAIGTPYIAFAGVQSSTSTPHVVTLTAGIPVGDVAIAAALEAGGRTLTGVTDSKGNTWVVDEPLANSTNHGGGVARAVIGTALVSGDTVSLSFSSTGVFAGVIVGVNGLSATQNDIDVSQANASSTTLASSTGATSDTADELQIGVGMHGASSATLTPETLSPVWTHISSQTSPTTARTIRVYYRIVSATEAQRFQGTLSSAQVNTGFFVTYRGAASTGAALAGTIAAAATLAGNLETDKPLAGTIVAIATLTGDLTAAGPAVLAGTIAASAGFVGNLTAPGPGAALAGIVASASAFVGALTAPGAGASLAGVIGIQTTFSAAFFTEGALPPLPAIGSTLLEIFGPSPGFDAWDTALWGTATWEGYSWQDVTPEAMHVSFGWGASNPEGILSAPVAGTWQVRTYDPTRILDPSNPSSALASILLPGTPVRVRFVGTTLSRVARTGVLDEIKYSLDNKLGLITATDGQAPLVAAKIPLGASGDGLKLWSRAHWVLAQSGIPNMTVEDGPGGLLDVEVGPALDDGASAWQWLDSSALDCLHTVWIDPEAVIRFRPFDTPIDNGLTIGGAVGIPVEDVSVSSSADGIYAHVIAFDKSAPTVAIEVLDPDAQARYGDVTYKRARPVPSAAAWADAVLDDRHAASTKLTIGVLRPRTEVELVKLLDAGPVEVATLVVNAVSPAVSTDVIIVGAKFEANTQTGWSAELITYVP